MEELKFNQSGDSMVYTPEICVYDGESIKIKLGSVDFAYSKATLYVNGTYLGQIKDVLGVHSTRLINGLNNIEFVFYDEKMVEISRLKTTFYKRCSIRGASNIEQEFTLLHNHLKKLGLDIELLNEWKEMIENERSGY